jgi:hypothetical protein
VTGKTDHDQLVRWMGAAPSAIVRSRARVDRLGRIIAEPVTYCSGVRLFAYEAMISLSWIDRRNGQSDL